jgi:hypothetical protein
MDDIHELLSRLRSNLQRDTRLYGTFVMRRARRQRVRRFAAGALGLGLSGALVTGLAWISTRDVDGTVRPGGNSPSVVYSTPSQGTCAFPPFRVTYLPWMEPGESIPEAELSRIPSDASGSPSYAFVSWKYGNVRYEGGPELKGTVTLWRTTEPPVDLPVDPAVPGLPGGSAEGALHTPPGGGDWAVVWPDARPGEYGDNCPYTTLAVNLPNLPDERVREETLRIAESLVRVTG